MKNSFKNFVYDNSKELPEMDDIDFEYAGCDVNAFSCPKNEICVPNNMKSRAGT